MVQARPFSAPIEDAITAESVIGKIGTTETLRIGTEQSLAQLVTLLKKNATVRSALRTGKLKVEATTTALAKKFETDPMGKDALARQVDYFAPINVERLRGEVTEAYQRALALNEEVERPAGELVAKSRFIRTENEDGSKTLELKETHEKLTAVALRDGSKNYEGTTEHGYHPDVEAFSKLMHSTFNPEECDPIEGTADFVNSNLDVSQFENGEYFGAVIKDAEGKAVGMVNVDYIPTRDHKTNELNGFGKIAIGYIIADEKYRGKGLSNELYRLAMEFGADAAKRRGQVFEGMIGESVPMLEPRVNSSLNSIARSRLFVKNAQDQFVESRYVQPNLDPQPGDEDNAGQSAEHLMYGAIAKQFVDERRVPINVVLDGVYAMYQRFGNFKGEKPAEMRQAVYDKNQAETQALFDQFEHDLRANSTDGYCYLITRQDRKAQIQSGTKFVEHVDGDHLEDAFADIKKAKEGPVKGYEEAMRYLIVDINPNPADLAAAITEFGPELEADIAMYQKRFIDRVN